MHNWYKKHYNKLHYNWHSFRKWVIYLLDIFETDFTAIVRMKQKDGFDGISLAIYLTLLNISHFCVKVYRGRSLYLPYWAHKGLSNKTRSNPATTRENIESYLLVNISKSHINPFFQTNLTKYHWSQSTSDGDKFTMFMDSFAIKWKTNAKKYSFSAPEIIKLLYVCCLWTISFLPHGKLSANRSH